LDDGLLVGLQPEKRRQAAALQSEGSWRLIREWAVQLKEHGNEGGDHDGAC
jgi:hypothetical protein